MIGHQGTCEECLARLVQPRRGHRQALTQGLLDLTARLADDFATRADEHDRDNTFPFENFDALKEARYTALPIAEELGGGHQSSKQ